MVVWHDRGEGDFKAQAFLGGHPWQDRLKVRAGTGGRHVEPHVALTHNARVGFTWTRVFDISDERSPYLLGELTATRPVESLWATGDLLHLAEHGGTHPNPCPPGAAHCPPGTHVEVFDVSDPSAPAKAGQYDGAASPAVHLRLNRDLGVVRTASGLQVYTLEAAP